MEKMALRGLLAISLIAVSFFSCTDDPKQPDQPEILQNEAPLKPGPEVNADSMFSFVEKQVSFGPRVPNTEGHARCAVWIESKLKSYGMEVSVQQAEVTAFDGKKLRIKNITGKFKPENKERIALFTHWDTRPFADRDNKDTLKPILGANDGGSGTAVLLEIARVIKSLPPDVGVDFIFFDAEDYGQPEHSQFERKEDTYCLGSQYWAKNLPAGPKPKYGILLDMVGAKDAIFPKEGTSVEYAPHIVDKVWGVAQKLSHGNRFVNIVSGPTVDDHLYVNYFAKIPSIDIVHYDPSKTDYGPFHHRHTDNLDIIDKEVLKTVASVVVTVLANE